MNKYQKALKTITDILGYYKENFVMLLQEYGFVEYKACKFKVSQFEYDLLTLLKESSERDKRLTLYAMGRYGYFKYMTSDMDIDEILNKCEVFE